MITNVIKNSIISGYGLLTIGWSDIELAWEDLNETFKDIRSGNYIAVLGLQRKFKLWEDGKVDGWDGMRGFWEAMDRRTRKIDGCGSLVEVRENLVKMEKLTASINTWTETIPTCVWYAMSGTRQLNKYCVQLKIRCMHLTLNLVKMVTMKVTVVINKTGDN